MCLPFISLEAFERQACHYAGLCDMSGLSVELTVDGRCHVFARQFCLLVVAGGQESIDWQW